MTEGWVKTTIASAGTSSFEPSVTDVVQFNIRGEGYMLPALEHEQCDVIAALCAVVVKLHKRVEELECTICQDRAGPSHDI